MKPSLTPLALALCAVVTFTTLPTFADDYVVSSCPDPCTHPPRDSAHIFISGFRTEPFPFTGLPGIALRTAKSGRMLVVDAAMQNATPTVPITFEMLPRVNGVSMDSFMSPGIDCGGHGTVPVPSVCTATGHWWLDLDQHPELLGEQLDIALIVGTDHQGGQDPIVGLTLSAHLERK